MIDPAVVQGEQNFSDTLSVGHQYILEPNFSNTKNSFYQWSVEGAIVSYDSIFKYIPATRGKHLMEVSIENRGVPSWVNYDVFTWGAYENRFYLINEGWFECVRETVSFYRYDTEQLEDSLYAKANSTKNLNPFTSSVEFGTIDKDGEKTLVITSSISILQIAVI